jgi:hypothetical protein
MLESEDAKWRAKRLHIDVQAKVHVEEATIEKVTIEEVTIAEP